MADVTTSKEQVMMTLEEILESREYKFFQRPAFRSTFQMDDQELLNLFLELQTWEAPKYIQEGFKYTFAGYDIFNRPIWMSTVGKFPYKEVLNRGDGDILERYLWKKMIWVVKSIVAKSLEENPSEQILVVNNFDGFSVTQILHAPTMAYRYKMAGKYKAIIPDILGQAVAINMNRFSAWLLNLFRPLLGQTLEKVEVFGKDESKWTPRLQELMGRMEIPSFIQDLHDFPQIILVT